MQPALEELSHGKVAAWWLRPADCYIIDMGFCVVGWIGAKANVPGMPRARRTTFAAARDWLQKRGEPHIPIQVVSQGAERQQGILQAQLARWRLESGARAASLHLGLAYGELRPGPERQAFESRFCEEVSSSLGRPLESLQLRGMADARRALGQAGTVVVFDVLDVPSLASPADALQELERQALHPHSVLRCGTITGHTVGEHALTRLSIVDSSHELGTTGGVRVQVPESPLHNKRPPGTPAGMLGVSRLSETEDEGHGQDEEPLLPPPGPIRCPGVLEPPCVKRDGRKLICCGADVTLALPSLYSRDCTPCCVS